ncbi:MAG TPA: Clp protease N-terminal domain-containing protein [Acidimicrobiales bacterium]|nr:Clp protease N-terminal domain-containing protein [Acidimicrobiales bacterium]
MTHHLVGAAEVAAILGVSRQRVAQLVTSTLDFPLPEVELSAGRIWAREAIERWAAYHAERGPRARGITVPAAGQWPPAVQTVADIASQQASDLNHHWLGIDHVLLALLHPDCPGLARAVLESFGLTLEDCRAALAASMGDPFEPHNRGLTVAPATQLLFDAAKLKAVELHDEEVASEHVLLALTEKWQSRPMTAMLAGRRVEAAEVRHRTLAMSEAVDGAGAGGWSVPELGPWPD